MPKGPQGQKRPADVIGNAVHVMRIATGEIDEVPQSEAVEGKRKGGVKGGAARAKALDHQTRRQIAQKAADARWGKKPE